MYKLLTMIAIFIAAPSVTLAQSGHSPYPGQEKGEIKSLSAEEIQAYLSGDGMGWAKAAELNHYPGPKHVLDLAADLHLSQRQISTTKVIYDGMQREAAALGKLVVEKERLLDSLFANQKMDKARLGSVVAEIAKLQGKLRAAHLAAHLQTKKALSPEQIAAYDALSGYESKQEQDPHHH